MTTKPPEENTAASQDAAGTSVTVVADTPPQPSALDAVTKALAVEAGADDGAPPDKTTADPPDPSGDKKDAALETKQAAADETDDDEKFAATLKKNARERFQKLNERTKALTLEKQRALEEAQTHKTALAEFANLFQSTGATAEQMAQAIELSLQLKSGTPADRKAALARIEEMRAQLAIELGVDAPGVDALDGFDDLKKSVENMEITRQLALELAASRRHAQQADTTMASEQERMRRQKAFDVERDAAIEEMNVFGQKLATEDPAYAEKIAILQKEFFPYIQREVPPRQWKRAFTAAWATLDRVRTTPKQSVVPASPRLAGGSAEIAPKSQLEAVTRALAAMTE
jgi:hypothetical protein